MRWHGPFADAPSPARHGDVVEFLAVLIHEQLIRNEDGDIRLTRANIEVEVPIVVDVAEVGLPSSASACPVPALLRHW